MAETILVVCDNCGAKPKVETDHSGWVTARARTSPGPTAAATLTYWTGTTGVPFRRDLDLCPECVKQIREAKTNGYPNAPERVA